MPALSQMQFLGVDPGVSGGLVVLDHAGHVVVARKMPETDRDLLDFLNNAFGYNYETPVFGMVERVHSMPKQGHNGAFTFGRNIGALHMALTASEIPFDLVTPQMWQRVMGCLTKGDKNVSKRRAQQLFPRQPITHAIADACLIAEYCRRTKGPQHGQKEEEGHTTFTESEVQTERRRQEAQGPRQARSPTASATPRHGTAPGSRA